MPGLSFYDKQHIQKVAAQQTVIANIFNQFILSVSPYLRKWDDAGKSSVWVRNQGIENAVDRELLTLKFQLETNIELFQRDAWDRSNKKNDDFIRKYIEGMSISTATKEGMFSHNLTALEALQKNTDINGLRLSDRVWNITQQTKSQLEFYLDSGVATGRNSKGISSDIRQILHEPDKRFRRVRNEKGELVLSQPMKNYHPGQGVYRSSYMNTLRTSATTTNTAYRSADYERWSQQDFVLGIEIQRSANHKGPCKICDAMVGKYPKTFKFTGWHPFCICFATPITMEPEDLADYLLTDEVPEQLVIKDIPNAAQSFVDNNKQALDKAYWMKDNFTKEGSLQRQVTKPESPITIDKKQVFDFNAKTPQEAIEYIKTHIADNVSLEIKKGDLPLINSIINQMQQRMSEFNMQKFSNVGKPSGKNALASWDGHDNSINFNLSKLKNTTSVWNKEMAWKKKGIKYSAYESESDIIRCTIDHELGHKLFGQYNMRMDVINTFGKAGKTVNGINEINDILGYYASTDIEEYFAETVGMYLGPGKKKLGKETTAMMERFMEKVDKNVDKASKNVTKIKRVKTDEEKIDIQKRWNDRSVRNFNQSKIEQKIGIKKGEDMTFEAANELRGNMNYGRGKEYGVNCQSCVVANELRRRGYDVTALPNLKKTGNIPYELSGKTNWAWIDPETMTTPVKKKAGGIYDVTRTGALKSKNISALTKEIIELVKEPGRYHIDFSWKNQNSGHIITLEKLANGKIVLYDPQNGKIVNWADISKRIKLQNGVNVLRVDNLLVNTDIIDGIVKKLQ